MAHIQLVLWFGSIGIKTVILMMQVEEYILGTASNELDGETSLSPLSILIPSDASIRGKQ